MESLLLVIHVIVALAIIGLIMLQQGKGAEMGASFGGGGSQTVFGAAGSGNFFSRMTAILVTVFFITSFVLAMIAQNKVEVDDLTVPSLETVVDEIPSADVVEDTSEVPEIPVENEDEAYDVPALEDASEPEDGSAEIEEFE